MGGVGAVVACAVAVGSCAEVDKAADDGQPDLPSGGGGELPSAGQRDYFVSLLSMAEART